MANVASLKPFTKGDKRINRKGRPKSFDSLRKLAQDIAHEELQSGDVSMTTTEAILRKWALSKDPRLQMEFMAVAYGRTPQSTEVSGKGGGPIEHKDVTELSDEDLARIAATGRRGITDQAQGTG